MKQKILVLITACCATVFTCIAQSNVYPQMVSVEGGTFIMGNEKSGADKNNPAHKVTVSNFSIGKYEISVAEYRSYLNSIGKTMPADQSEKWIDKNPMQYISYFDALNYCDWLSKQTKRKYRLPTETEWEYAASGGNKRKSYTLYAGSNNLSEVAWWSENNPKFEYHMVGQKAPNDLGLFDMSGNVSEWCNDWYDDDYYITGSTDNPIGPLNGTTKVARGGTANDQSMNCLNTTRDRFRPEQALGHLGFRVVVKEKYGTQSLNEQKLQNLMNKYKSYDVKTTVNGRYAHMSCDSIEFKQTNCYTIYNVIKYLKGYKTITEVEFEWKNIESIRYNVKWGNIRAYPSEGNPTILSDLTMIKFDSVDTLFTGKSFTEIKKLNEPSKFDFQMWFKPESTDKDGEAKRDIMEIITLIKKIKKECGGGELKVIINEEW